MLGQKCVRSENVHNAQTLSDLRCYADMRAEARQSGFVPKAEFQCVVAGVVNNLMRPLL